MSLRTVALGVVLVAVALPAFPHGGGLDRNGCHTNRKTGQYHCHRAPAASPRPQAGSLPQAVVGPTSSFSRTEGVATAVTESELVGSIQLLLASLSYEVGSPDGKVGAKTEAAIRQFQSDNHMLADGRPTGQLLVRLSETVLKRARA